MQVLVNRTDFELSTQSLKWVKHVYEPFFDKPFYHDIINFVRPDIFETSLLGKEIRTFLKKYGLNTKYTGIQTFVSNWPEYYQGNPHIDFYWFKNMNYAVNYRFNILIYGSTKDRLFYWKNFDRNNLEIKQFSHMKLPAYTSYGIPGNSVEDRWKYLGQPTDTVNNYLIQSSFIRTDLAHTVEVSAGPRLVLSVGFKEIELNDNQG